ncbi:MAG: dolichol kinase, partial [Candidatus Thermoplasmatota archaeon]|nr:dolichol kinase [Candidatus Thermoplasmatota archaeon]
MVNVKDVKQRLGEVKEKLDETTKKINAIDFDAHLYRRVFHVFGASFLFYYVLPKANWVNLLDWINILKIWVPVCIVITIILLEILRVKSKINSNHFFGLRTYEKKRVGGYVFFAVAILILFLFFPQQIAIPCILCACLADPIMGEIRYRFSEKHAYIMGFLVCMFFFIVTWYKADFSLMILVSIVGATGAVVGETKKFWWLD